MATLIKDSRGRSPFWVCAYTAADGRRLKKSTKVRITPSRGDKKTAAELREDAMSVCISWSRLADAGRGRNITETQARRVVAEIYEQSTGDALHFQNCRDWLQNWLASKDGTTAQATLIKYRQVIEDFIEHLKDKALKPLGAISPADIISFQKSMRDRKLAASTINLAIKKTLNAPFAEAHKLGYIPVNPVAGVKSLKDDVKVHRDIFTAEQINSLLKEARETDWEGAILCGVTTGLRLGDIANLAWKSVDLDRRLLETQTQKTRQVMTIPLHRDFLVWLNGRTRGIGNAPIFPGLFGRKSGGCNGLSVQFAKLLQRVGVKGRMIRSGEGSGHRTSSLTFHSLRHTFTSAMANAGVHPDLRRKLTGHSDDTVHARYSHHEIETLREAIEKVAMSPKEF